MSVTNPCKASDDTLQPLYEMLSSSQSLGTFLLDTEHYHFDIEYAQKSESAWILFVQLPTEKKQIVIKLLCDYQDTRYSQGSIKERQNCQLEAIKWNRTFSPYAYYGLARVCDLNVQQKKIVLDQIITYPTHEELCQGSDYALVMRQLPKESRLDSFLNSEHEDSFRYLQLLIQCIVQIHESREVLSLEECERWGSCDQLQKKLHHNLSLADSVLTATKEGQYTYTELFREMFMSLKNMLLQHFAWDLYKGYFDHRVQNRCIKRCHGDLKAPNIYLEPDYVSGEKSVSILDAIDFNPTYCNIDTLSDFAMLVIDIQARTGSSKLAEFLLEKYLKDTRQEDDCSRAVLNYYLFEKAYVGAAISIVYDALPELGWAYLQIAKSRLDCLLKQTVLAL